MKTDNYTKFLLTIIAACLCILVLQNVKLVPEAQAEIPARYALVPLNDDGSINVKVIEQSVTDVNIQAIGGMRVFGNTLNVKINN